MIIPKEPAAHIGLCQILGYLALQGINIPPIAAKLGLDPDKAANIEANTPVIANPQ